MVYFNGSVVGVKGSFWEDCPMCHGLSDFRVLLHCFGRGFCKMGENTQQVSSSPWYNFMDLWFGEGFVLGGLYYVPSNLTFSFCSTVVADVKMGKTLSV